MTSCHHETGAISWAYLLVRQINAWRSYSTVKDVASQTEEQIKEVKNKSTEKFHLYLSDHRRHKKINEHMDNALLTKKDPSIWFGATTKVEGMYA